MVYVIQNSNSDWLPPYLGHILELVAIEQGTRCRVVTKESTAHFLLRHHGDSDKQYHADTYIHNSFKFFKMHNTKRKYSDVNVNRCNVQIGICNCHERRPFFVGWRSCENEMRKQVASRRYRHCSGKSVSCSSHTPLTVMRTVRINSSSTLQRHTRTAF